MTAELDFVNKRSTYHGTLDRLIEYIKESDVNDLRIADVTARFEKLNGLEIKFESIQEKIEQARRVDERYNPDQLNALSYEEGASYEEKLNDALAVYKKAYTIVDKRENPEKYIVRTPQINNTPQQQVANIDRRNVQVRLPKIEMPIFSRADEDWL